MRYINRTATTLAVILTSVAGFAVRAAAMETTTPTEATDTDGPTFVVESTEPLTLRLESPSGIVVTMPREWFPKDVREGSVLRFREDKAEESARLREASERIGRMLRASR